MGASRDGNPPLGLEMMLVQVNKNSIVHEGADPRLAQLDLSWGMMAIGWKIGPKQMATMRLASLVHFGCQLKCGGGEDLLVGRLLLLVDVEVEAVEELATGVSLGKIVKYWHL